MQSYELTMILDGKATSAKKTAIAKLLEKVVGINKGKLGKMSDWGVIDLSYKIKKRVKGAYLHFPLTLDPKFVKELDTKLKMEEDILRHLIVRI